MSSHDQVLRVWGDLACFARPEMKVERFSYPVITPSAARGIYDSIYCKPAEFRWQVTVIEILKPLAWIALRRNEVKSKILVNKVENWMQDRVSVEPFWADDDRTQRQTIALKEVEYRLTARIVPWPGVEHQLSGLEHQFRRRAERGKCFCQPCFGCREFPAYFALDEQAEPCQPQLIDLEIGLMLYDVFDLSRQAENSAPPFISVFRARVSDGRLTVPDWNDVSVLKIKEVPSAAPSN
jgi:CRISPR-associated protein Cas5d